MPNSRLPKLRRKSIAVTGRETGKYISVVIDYTDRTPGNHADPFEIGNNGDALGLQVCQGIVQSHGGEIRLTRNLPAAPALIELPLLEEAPEQRVNYIKPARPLTVLMVEPDKDARRKLLAVLSERGHRAVPMQSAEEASPDMAHRLRFDIVFSAVRLPSMNSVEFFEKIRREIGSLRPGNRRVRRRPLPCLQRKRRLPAEQTNTTRTPSACWQQSKAGRKQ